MIHKYNHNLVFKLILPNVICYTTKNNFLNKRSSFIPQINKDLATPLISDPDLKSPKHSPHNNNITLELFKKRSVVDFTIDEIFA